MKPLTQSQIDDQTVYNYLKDNGPTKVLRVSGHTGLGWIRTIRSMERLWGTKGNRTAKISLEGICHLIEKDRE